MIRIEIDVAIPKGLLEEVRQNRGEGQDKEEDGIRFAAVGDALDFLWVLASRMSFNPEEWREASPDEIRRLLPGQLVSFSDGKQKHIPYVSVGKPMWKEKYELMRTFRGERFGCKVLPEQSGVLLKIPAEGNGQRG